MAKKPHADRRFRVHLPLPFTFAALDLEPEWTVEQIFREVEAQIAAAEVKMGRPASGHRLTQLEISVYPGAKTDAEKPAEASRNVGTPKGP